MNKASDCRTKSFFLVWTNPYKEPVWTLRIVNERKFYCDPLSRKKTRCAPEDMLIMQHQDLSRYKLGFPDCTSKMYLKPQRTRTENRFSSRFIFLRKKMVRTVFTFNCRVQICLGGLSTRLRVKSPCTPQIRKCLSDFFPSLNIKRVRDSRRGYLGRVNMRDDSKSVIFHDRTSADSRRKTLLHTPFEMEHRYLGWGLEQLLSDKQTLNRKSSQQFQLPLRPHEYKPMGLGRYRNRGTRS